MGIVKGEKLLITNHLNQSFYRINRDKNVTLGNANFLNITSFAQISIHRHFSAPNGHKLHGFSFKT
jgi:hypothetical protein